jgi:PPE-repeat protein
MTAAAAAWDVLAAELSSAAAGYGSIVSELVSDGWLGPASLSMATAAAPYVAWLHATAVQAERTATAAKEAAAAYEFAFAMTVPPPVIAANRSLLMALIATNFFGQNTPAIAATETHYAEMWIQDAAAMYGYAEASAAASQLTPFTAPQPNTDPGGLHAQAGALQGLSDPTAQSMSSPSLVDYLLRIPNVTNSALSSSNAVTSGRSIFIQNSRLAFQEAQDAEMSAVFGGRLVSRAPVAMRGSAASAVMGGMGRATSVGALSVPPNWVTVAPEIRPVALALPNADGGIASAASPDMSPVPGSACSQSVLGTLSRHEFNGPRRKSKPVIVRSPAAG